MNQGETFADYGRAENSRDKSDESGLMNSSSFDDHLFWRPASTTNKQVHVHVVLLLNEDVVNRSVKTRRYCSCLAVT